MEKTNILNKVIIVILVIVLFLLFSCSEKNKESINDKYFTIKTHELMERQFKINKVIVDGDSVIYDELRIYYMDNAELIEFLGIALIMANKYDYTIAYHDVAYALYHANSAFSSKNPNAYDTATRKMFNDYLNVALKRNCPNAIDLKEWYESK
ncbi:MAG: hypothetical protein K1X55_17335 [Chitinophagales bacterium]|nr:hypothetical protein [Chitinophagales bacterium]